MTALLIISILLVLLLTSTPISIALGTTVLIYLLGFSSFSIDTVNIISQRLFTGLESFSIMAVPFFVLSGQFLIDGKIAARIVRFASNLVGWMPGGIAMAAVLACAFFATISGSSPATVMAIGSVMLPAMIKAGYPKRFSVGVITSAGSLGILIPPSIVMIIYSVATSESAGKMFIAGIVPGIMLAVIMMSLVFIQAKRKHFPTQPKPTAAEFWQSFRDAWSGIFMVVLVIGGIYGGLFTPTEAAAVAAVYAFVAAKFFSGDLSWRQVPKTLLSAANTSAMLLYIITNAILFSFLMTSEQIPQEMSAWVVAQNLQPWMFLLMVNLALLAAGQFMEPTSIVLILAPLFLPIAKVMGIDPIHLGIIMVVNMEIGMIHPPVGLNLFVASHLAKEGLTEVSIATLPWVGVMLVYLGLITYIPAISTWLPHLLYKLTLKNPRLPPASRGSGCA
jgi:C4-dicarboxylate transporter DctM subunit